MATVIDSLLIVLGLETKDFQKSSKEAQKTLKDTGQQASVTGSQVSEAMGKKAADGVIKLKHEMLSIAGLVLGGMGFKSFIANAIHVEAATGRLATNLGVSVETLSRWQNAVRRFGGTREGIAGSMAAASKAVSEFINLHQTNPMVEAMRRVFGSDLKVLQDGTLDVVDFYLKAADKMKGMSATQAGTFGRMFGMDEGTINMLRRGREEVEKLLAAQQKYTEKDARQAQELENKWRDLSDAATHLAQTVATSSLFNAAHRLQRLEEPFKDKSTFAQDFFTGIIGAAEGTRAVLTSDAKKRIAEIAQARLAGRRVSGLVTYEGGAAAGGTGDMRTQLKRYGWSDAQTDGILANLMAESKMNPGAVGDNGLAYGLGQWHPDRQAAFKTYMGRDIRGSSVEDQLAFLNYELTAGSEQAAGAMLRRARSSAEAAALLSRFYERPADANGEALRRASIAASISGAPLGGGYAASGRATVSNETHIGQIVVNTQATDAEGIGRDIRGAIAANGLVEQTDSGLN